jgi:UDP-glucose:(heptosyl)LPS alpha-1,3-glucosyltransferase
MVAAMRLALVHMRHAHRGGTERYLNQLASFLVDEGHDVTIVCRSHEEPPRPAVHFQVLRDPSVGSAWRMWAFARAVERHVRQGDYDVVVGLGKTWTHDVIRLGGGTQRTYLELAHQDTLEGWERLTGGGALKHHLALRIEERALSPGAYRRVIANSEMVKADVMARHAVPAEAVRVVHNGVDTERFDRERHADAARDLRRELGLEGDQVVVLFLGTGYGRKGLELVLEAMPEVVGARPDVRLVVAGRDSAQARYERRAEKLGVDRWTTFLGERRDAEVCLAAADVYALPTRYDPFANTTLEALASGLPVVTTRTNGGSEVLSPDTGSVLASPEVPALAAALTDWTERGRFEAARGPTRATAGQHTVERAMRASAAVLAECETVPGAS